MATKTIPEITDKDVRQLIDTLETPKKNGPAFAALLSAGLGSAALGVFTTLAVAITPFKDAMVINKGVGPLSGKTTYAVAVFVLSWIVLAFVMRGKHYPERPLFIATFVLVAIGVIGTFPLFFDLFAP